MEQFMKRAQVFEITIVLFYFKDVLFPGPWLCRWIDSSFSQHANISSLIAT